MTDLVTTGLLLVTAGVAIVAISIISREERDKTEVKGGGVVMIGPVPIIFGSDKKWASAAMVLAIVLVLAYILLWVA